MYGYQSRGSEEDRDRFFAVVSSDRTGGNGHKLKHRRCHQKHKEKHLTVRVAEDWYRLPRKVVESSFLEIFKNHLGEMVLGSLLKVVLIEQGGWSG